MGGAGITTGPNQLKSNLLNRSSILQELAPPYDSSIDLLHLGSLVSGAVHFLKGWKIVVVSEALVIIIDAKSKLDHPVDATSELSRLIEIKSGGQERGIEEEPDQIFNR